MRKLLILLTVLASITVAEAKDMSLTVNIYYTGENGNARKFAEEHFDSVKISDFIVKHIS